MIVHGGGGEGENIHIGTRCTNYTCTYMYIHLCTIFELPYHKAFH